MISLFSKQFKEKTQIMVAVVDTTIKNTFLYIDMYTCICIHTTSCFMCSISSIFFKI